MTKTKRLSVLLLAIVLGASVLLLGLPGRLAPAQKESPLTFELAIKPLPLFVEE